MFEDNNRILWLGWLCVVALSGCPQQADVRQESSPRQVTVNFRAPWSLRILRRDLRQGDIWQSITERLVNLSLSYRKSGACRPIAPRIFQEYRHGLEHHCLLQHHVLEKGLWVLGKQEGEWWIEEVQGQKKIASLRFFQGRLHGPVRVWHANGQPWIFCHFYRDYKQGTCQWWYDNGQKQREASFRDDDRHGLERVWFEHGQPLSQCTFVRDVPEGRCVRWYATGQRLWDRFYRDGKPHGSWGSWFSNGKPMIEQTFSQGQPCGVATYWLDNGKIAHQTQYPSCPVSSGQNSP